MAGTGRFLPVATLLSDRQLLGESGHWDASSKSHVYDIRERQLSANSGRSDKRVFWKLPTDHLMRDHRGDLMLWPALAINPLVSLSFDFWLSRRPSRANFAFTRNEAKFIRAG